MPVAPESAYSSIFVHGCDAENRCFLLEEQIVCMGLPNFCGGVTEKLSGGTKFVFEIGFTPAKYSKLVDTDFFVISPNS